REMAVAQPWSDLPPGRCAAGSHDRPPGRLPAHGRFRHLRGRLATDGRVGPRARRWKAARLMRSPARRLALDSGPLQRTGLALLGAWLVACCWGCQPAAEYTNRTVAIIVP